MAPGDVLAALADPSRRRLLETLSRAGPCTATELAAGMPITRQAVAKHLAQLHRAGIVEPQRSGRETRYRLVTQPLQDAIAWLDGVCRGVRRGRTA